MVKGKPPKARQQPVKTRLKPSRLKSTPKASGTRRKRVEPPKICHFKATHALLPQLVPCDVILEYKQKHVTKTQLEALLPQGLRPCALKLPKLEVPIGSASTIVKKDAPTSCKSFAVLNTGCYVSLAAWSPCGLVLALAVHGREQPASPAEGPAQGLAALQLWRVQLEEASPTSSLRVGLVHEGGCARSLEWLPSKSHKDRLGLLLACLGDGKLCIYSLPKNAFEPKSLSRAWLFARFAPAWTAVTAPEGAQPAAVWQRYLQCASARAGSADPTGLTIAAGCERGVVLVWRLSGKGTPERAPCEVLKPNTLDADLVVSIAWCPRSEELLVAGLSTGYLVLWDLSVPVVPLRCFMPASRLPMMNLSWTSDSTLCLPSECAIIEMHEQRMSQIRSNRGSGGKHLVKCAGMCSTAPGIFSAWSDGVLNLTPRRCLHFGKNLRSREAQKEDAWQCWGFSGSNDLKDFPFPRMAYSCPKEEAQRKEYIQKMFLEYEYEIVNHHRLWETKKCTLEIGSHRPESALPLSCVAATLPKGDGSFALATGSMAGIVSLMLIKETS
ncbi:Uncharacterized protein SCF082_LOCUS25478 [Durusdinium trenchii]|uniref:Uncharacterized protein n=1 Tax=Durusdinium trenchii TaxID=1381693 RepID=A0ABP0M0F4_9DINO